MYKFEKLEVYQLALDYIDQAYAVSDKLPRHQAYICLERALVPLVQWRTSPLSKRGVAYLKADQQLLRHLDDSGQTLARKLQAMRKAVIKS